MAERDSLPSQEGPGLDVDAAARGLAELEFDARVALPEAQERFQRAETENRRLRDALHTICGLTHQDIDEEPFWRLVSRIHEVARRAVDPPARETL